MLKTDRILTLDIGASKIVVAEFSAARSGVPELIRYGIGRLDIEPDSDEDPSAYVVMTLRSLMAERGMKPAPLAMTISGQSVFPRYVKLPPVTRDKVVQIIQYEAEQNVPFPIHEVVWDYQLIESDSAEGELNVMLVAVKTDMVERLTDCVLAAGLEPDIVDVSPMALYNAVRFNYPDTEGCTLILDIGARSSNLIFMEGRRIFSRSIPVAGNAVTQEIARQFDVPFAEAEQLKLTHGFVAFGGVYAGPESDTADRVSKIVRNVITRLHAEVNRSINFYRSQQGGSAPSLVLLTGGASITPHIDTFFREKLKVEVACLNPFVNVSVNPAVDTEQITDDLHVLGEVTGLALRSSLSCPVEMNLMPPDLVAKKIFRRRMPFFGLAAVGLVLAMLCWWVYFYRMRDMLTIRAESVDRKIAVLEAVTWKLRVASREKAAVQAKADEITGVVQSRTRWIEMIEDVRGATLDGMWLTSVKPMEDNMGRVASVEVAGKAFRDRLRHLEEAGAAGGTPIERFRDKLRESDHFTDKTEITWELPVVSDAYLREFRVRAVLAKPLKAE